jgi:hypothetical protein
LYAIFTDPETVLPELGEVIVTPDEPLPPPPPPPPPFATVTLTVVVPRLLPLESKAIAFTWCEPSEAAAVFHENELGGVELT